MSFSGSNYLLGHKLNKGGLVGGVAWIIYGSDGHEPAHSRGGPSYFCLGKSNQNRVSRDASLPHWAFPAQIRQNLGCNLFAPLRSRLALASAKSCEALQPHGPPLFCLILPEAVLLRKK
jgi:hypothetical protein